MSDFENDIPNLIDHSVKRLFRDQPKAVLRLVGIATAGTTVRFEDSTLNLPELRADHVFIVQESGKRPFAIYIEYQLKPNPKLLNTWSLKWAGLNDQLEMDVFLLVIYLEKADRATFPASLDRSRGMLRTAFSFNAVRLWEHRDRIVSGEMVELAPLLVLCEANPTEATLQRERELIYNSGLSLDAQAELMGIAVLVASRSFGQSVLRAIFREELAMIDSTEALENLKELFLETGKLQMWLKDPRVSGELQAAAKAEGKIEGKEEGKAEGKTEAIRQMTLTFLTRRFDELPVELVERIMTADADWCQSLFDRAIAATTLAELTDML